jgi:hypothetical protein
MGNNILIQTLNLAVILNILFCLFMFERHGRQTLAVYRKLVKSIIPYAVSITPAALLVYILYSISYRF